MIRALLCFNVAVVLELSNYLDLYFASEMGTTHKGLTKHRFHPLSDICFRTLFPCCFETLLAGF